MGAFRNKCAWAVKTSLLSLGLVVTVALNAHASYLDGFEQGGTFFDDGVGVVL